MVIIGPDHALWHRHTRYDSSGQGIAWPQELHWWITTASTRDKHICPRRHSISQSQHASGCRPTSQTARLPGKLFSLFHECNLSFLFPLVMKIILKQAVISEAVNINFKERITIFFNLWPTILWKNVQIFKVWQSFPFILLVFSGEVQWKEHGTASWFGICNGRPVSGSERIFLEQYFRCTLWIGG